MDDDKQFTLVAGILRPYLGQGGSQAASVNKIMELMTDDQHQDQIQYNENTFKKYFTGASPIDRLARRISGHLDSVKLAKCIDQLDYRARSEISHQLKAAGIKTHPAQVGDACAKLLEEIINEAAQVKTALTKKPPLYTQQRSEMMKISTNVLPDKVSETQQNYELFIRDDVDFSHDGGLMIKHNPSRLFGENTDERLYGKIWDQDGFLSKNVKHYPVIFGNEFNGDDQQKYYYGLIDEINEGTCGIYLHYRIFGSVLREELYRIHDRIQIEPLEFYRRHWSMKHANIWPIIKQENLNE
ncbi:hypothetical protein DQM13_06030 [Limosilactobacillus fermentum]|uniref:hypothetical protein n=1 Tax=Limosilactobacillus fermentum TaxID=1613 RepID=UPI0003FE2491|nr:hypothetical protein [Limosilactobacillus fermentum]MCH5387878.1 hypothetical protein [Limosilactobacillus fermentum]MCS8609790.1 hypothetical protein [Limosilactobacillus fermentum]MCT3464137.1 hypothetical protein [Limosilactobacillus fermentum]MCT4373703.1 hypothetical protein [Limosilactobacillus fermentum]QSE65332.1 hypothetical protein JWS00_09050 [Limosilactobacillus fermentum]